MLRRIPVQIIDEKIIEILIADGILFLKIIAKIIPLVSRTAIKYLVLTKNISSKYDKPNNSPAAYIRKTGSSLIITIS